MRWIKKGLIFETKKQYDWMHSHAQCPTAIVLNDRIRIYFSARLVNQQSLPTFIDVDKSDLTKVLYINPTPILERGRRGTFDENGIIPSYIYSINDVLFFYYAGWSQCKNVPYKNYTGLATSNDMGLSFSKYTESPVFTMDKFNPLSATGPCIVEKDANLYAIYSTGIDWLEIEGKLEHTYLLTYATSKDGFSWSSSGKIIIEPEREFMAHCKPTIIEVNGLYHMWFSTRGSYNFRNGGSNAYRLGYAVSKDLINWERDDSRVGIDVSEDGWDSEMICYPNIISVNGKFIMFYNGNGFGKSGFGYAELQS
jgi:predicted GH43/DUF377 family glycosyl hydrolase